MDVLRSTRSDSPDTEGARNGATPSQQDSLTPGEAARLNAQYKRAFEAGRNDIKAEIVLCTAELAAGMLEKNDKNRPKGPATIIRYAHYIKTGQWRLNGEPIILGADGCLLDGQHRLMAIVRAGETVPLLVVPLFIVSGVSKDAFKTLNQGKVRSGADTLATMGKENARTLASALGWLNRYESNNIDYRGPRLSNLDLCKLLADHPGVQASVMEVRPECAKGYPPGPFSFLHYVCTSRHPKYASFFNQVLSGADLKAGSPAHKLTKVLNDMAKQPGKTQAQTIGLIAVTIKAFNATVEGKFIRSLSWSDKEEFPRVI